MPKMAYHDLAAYEILVAIFHETDGDEHKNYTPLGPRGVGSFQYPLFKPKPNQNWLFPAAFFRGWLSLCLTFGFRWVEFDVYFDPQPQPKHDFSTWGLLGVADGVTASAAAQNHLFWAKCDTVSVVSKMHKRHSMVNVWLLPKKAWIYTAIRNTAQGPVVFWVPHKSYVRNKQFTQNSYQTCWRTKGSEKTPFSTRYWFIVCLTFVRCCILQLGYAAVALHWGQADPMAGITLIPTLFGTSILLQLNGFGKENKNMDKHNKI